MHPFPLTDAHHLDRRKISGNGDDFFTEVAADAANIARKDKLQEEYKKVSRRIVK